MANPQKENGYTPIANEIIEKLVKVHLLGAELRILIFIIRKTYGFHKKKDIISLSQFQSGTGISRPTVVKALKNLMSRNMIVKVYLPDEDIEYSFVKDYEKWVVNTTKLVKYNSLPSKDRLTEISKDHLTHKRNKDIYTKDISKDKSLQDKSISYNPLGADIIKAFEEINPAVKRMYGNKTQRGACNLLLESYGLEKILSVVKILPQTNKMTNKFFPQITTPLELLDKWIKLENAFNNYKNNQKKSSVAFC